MATIMFNIIYARQVELLLRVLPIVAAQECLALKGGTAINLFLQNMPRLSVDIDLAYLPLRDRKTALTEITDSLQVIREKIRDGLPGAIVQQNADTQRLVIHSAEAQIKIEPNTVFRGTVYDPVSSVLCERAQSKFEQFIECRVSSTADLYGSKICAALDRQHPRDLFDIHLMFENVGLTNDIRTAFVVYLAGPLRANMRETV